jgi:hypothetical protein
MKLRLIKITPEGLDPEFMVVTEGSTAHTMVQDYAKDNGYPIEDRPCANRFACILQDLKRIEDAIEKYAPVILTLPAFDNGKPYNNHLSQCFWNIETACDEESSEVEHEWLAPDPPTYEEYTKDWSFEDKLRFLYDEDISLKPKTWTSRDLACAVKDPEYFVFETDSNLKQILLEREYIREGEEE